MQLEFNCLADIKGRVAESPVYDERTKRLYFVDILNRTIYGLELSSDARGSWSFESEVCSIGLCASGALVVALRHSIILFDPESERRVDFCRVEEEDAPTRLNDGRVGPDGAFWVGSMDDRPQKQPIAALYRVDPSGRVERKVEGLVTSNGLAWTADGEVMFHSDTRGPWIDRWRFDRESGAISERARFATLDDTIGRPDGGSCDAEGFYWSAGVSAGRLNRFAPDGSVADSFTLPVPAPTMPCFGGEDFRTLYLTSLTEGRAPELLANATCAGGLLAAESPVAGFPSWRFLDI